MSHIHNIVAVYPVVGWYTKVGTLSRPHRVLWSQIGYFNAYYKTSRILLAVCTTLLTHGNDDPVLPNTQGAYTSRPGLINRDVWWAQVNGPGFITRSSYDKTLWMVGVNMFTYHCVIFSILCYITLVLCYILS